MSSWIPVLDDTVVVSVVTVMVDTTEVAALEVAEVIVPQGLAQNVG